MSVTCRSNQKPFYGTRGGGLNQKPFYGGSFIKSNFMGWGLYLFAKQKVN